MSFAYDIGVLKIDSVFDDIDELEVGKIYSLTAVDIASLYRYCEDNYVAIDLEDGTKGATLNTYKGFLTKYPFIEIKCQVTDCVIDDNDELAVPHYKVRFIKAEATVNFWSETEDDLVQLKDDMKETFVGATNIQMDCGRTKGENSSLIIWNR